MRIVFHLFCSLMKSLSVEQCLVPGACWCPINQIDEWINFNHRSFFCSEEIMKVLQLYMYKYVFLICSLVSYLTIFCNYFV